MDTDPIDHKIDYAKEILHHNFELIKFADSKTGIILGINGVILTLLLTLGHQKISAVTFYFFISGVLTFGASGIFSILTLYPRTKPLLGLPTLIYSDKIGKINKDDLDKKWNLLTDAKILEEYTLLNYNIQIVKQRKYSYLKYSVFLVMTGVLFLIITIFLDSFY